MDARWIEILGWTATALFVGSYFGKKPSTLRRVQMLGASLWIVYGLVIRATPVVAANTLVFLAAGWSELRARRPLSAAARSTS